MRRPLVFLSLAALSGVLWGIGEADRLFCLSLSAFILLFIKRSSKGRGRRLPLLFIYLCAALITVTGYLRAGQVSRDFEKRSDFFEAHGATNPGQFDYGLYLKGEGISSEAELQEKYDGYQGEDPLKRGLRDARAYLGSVIDRYMTADEEDKYIVAQANEPLDADNKFVNKRVKVRFRDLIEDQLVKIIHDQIHHDVMKLGLDIYSTLM